MDISIIILNWNGLDFLKTCIPSGIIAVDIYGKDCEIIVVDNGSSDESIDYLRSNFSLVKVISLKENLCLE